MKFVVDQQLPPAVVSWLAACGCVAEHVRDVGLRDADDGQIWGYALMVEAIVLTKDQDFANRRIASASGPVIVWLRAGNMRTPKLIAWLERRWPMIVATVAAGDG
jgi:predicted nuclease of predicted toxin-antitoxin system